MKFASRKESMLTGLAFLIASAIVNAQATPEEYLYQEILRGTEKRALINAALALSDLEASIFLPIYEAYEQKRRGLAINYTRTLNKYIQDYNNLTDRKAKKHARQLLKYYKQFDDLRYSYYFRMKNSLGAMKAFQILQIEIHIQEALEYDLQSDLPFIRQLGASMFSDNKKTIK